MHFPQKFLWPSRWRAVSDGEWGGGEMFNFSPSNTLTRWGASAGTMSPALIHSAGRNHRWCATRAAAWWNTGARAAWMPDGWVLYFNGRIFLCLSAAQGSIAGMQMKERRLKQSSASAASVDLLVKKNQQTLCRLEGKLVHRKRRRLCSFLRAYMFLNPRSGTVSFANERGKHKRNGQETFERQAFSRRTALS